MSDRADVEVDRFQAPEGAFDAGQILVSLDGFAGPHGLDGQARAHDVDPAEPGFVPDTVGLAPPGEARLTDPDLKVLGHLVSVEHGAGHEADLGLAAHRVALARPLGRELRQTMSRSPGNRFGGGATRR
ncbi:MAG TPA: hypothetical protein VKS60_19885 [Stellaceae bacterium]|nr:hypothetical protein [Stellaceae bacterium]